MPSEVPHLVVSDPAGRLMAHPDLKVCGRSGRDLVELAPEDFIALPEGSELMSLPSRIPFGLNEESGEFEAVTEGPEGEEVWGAAAFMAPAYTGLYTAAYTARPGAPTLPLFAYTALGELDGKYYVPALRVDTDKRQDPSRFDEKKVAAGIKKLLKERPGNRLVEHLSNCATVNACAAAKNFFLERHEAPIPSSPQCNSACVGCLSFQEPEAGFPSTQNRIAFTPTAAEIAACIVPHFERAELAVASFGQGCEGDPLMNPPLLEEALRLVRAKTSAGTLNLNTNGSRPDAVKKLMKAGLDAIRVSMNSAQEGWYNAYYRPRGYTFADVRASVKAVAELGGRASINYFVFPGVSDREQELEALIELIKESGLSLIQWRNLNLDPDLYLETIGDPAAAGKALGLKFVFDEVKRQFPKMRYGYFNPAWRDETRQAA